MQAAQFSRIGNKLLQPAVLITSVGTQLGQGIKHTDMAKSCVVVKIGAAL